MIGIPTDLEVVSFKKTNINKVFYCISGHSVSLHSETPKWGITILRQICSAKMENTSGYLNSISVTDAAARNFSLATAFVASLG